MRPQQRLKRRGDWKRVRREGRCASDSLMIVCILSTPGAGRVGFSTTRGFTSAVARNRARRRVREIFRQMYADSLEDRTVTVTARPLATEAAWADLVTSMGRLLGRLDVIPKTQ